MLGRCISLKKLRYIQGFLPIDQQIGGRQWERRKRKKDKVEKITSEKEKMK